VLQVLQLQELESQLQEQQVGESQEQLVLPVFLQLVLLRALVQMHQQNQQ
jgi:hypothetical protein